MKNKNEKVGDEPVTTCVMRLLYPSMWKTDKDPGGQQLLGLHCNGFDGR